MVGAANDLNITQSGFQSFNSTNGIFAGRTLIAGAGISITNPDGMSGNPTVSLLGGGNALEHLTGNTGVTLNPDGSNNINIVTANSTALIAGAASTLTLDFNLTNLILGTKPAVSGTQNVGLGSFCLTQLTTGSSNTCMGQSAGGLITTGGSNTLYGLGCGQTLVSTNNNSAFGTSALALSIGSNNTAIGYQALNSLASTGSSNIALGHQAGTSYTTTEGSNIVIGIGTGTVADSHTIRIGNQGGSATQQNLCFIAGIIGNAVSNQTIVTIDSSGTQLGNVTTVPVANGGTGAATLTGILIGNGTSAVTANPITQFDVLVGGVSNAITSVGPGTANTVLRSGGNAANPSYSTNFKISSTDVMTNSSQPAFLAYLSAQQSNVTGDGTVYQIAFDAVAYDVGTHFTTGASAHYTFPVTGKYLISSNVCVFNATAGLMQVQIVATSRGVQGFLTVVLNEDATIAQTVLIDATAGDTLLINAIVSGGAKTSAVLGNASPYETFVSGILLA